MRATGLPTDKTAAPLTVCSLWTRLSKGEGSSPLSLLATLFLILKPRRLLGFFAARAHCWLMVNFVTTTTPRSFSAKPFPSHLNHRLYWGLGYSSPGAGPVFSLCWTSGGSCQLISSTYPCPSEQQHSQLVHQTLLPVTVCKLAEGALHATVYVINKEVKQYWHRHQPFGYTTHDQPPHGLCFTDYGWSHLHITSPQITDVL